MLSIIQTRLTFFTLFDNSSLAQKQVMFLIFPLKFHHTYIIPNKYTSSSLLVFVNFYCLFWCEVEYMYTSTIKYTVHQLKLSFSLQSSKNLGFKSSIVKAGIVCVH